MKKNLFSMLILCFIGLQSVLAQSREVSGVVTSEDDGLSIPGVSVIIKGTTIGTTTDFDGNYTISVPEGNQFLVFSFVGMKKTELPVNSNTINLVMESESIGMDEVMVVAYGTAKKSSFTGSASVVGAEKLEERTLSSVGQALEGSGTGIQVASTSGQPGSSPSIRIRGFGTLTGDGAPLYIVDGSQYEGSLSDISPDDIASMTVLKDASSTALYGSRAGNGVILITTKKGKRNSSKIKFNLKATTGIVSQSIPKYETVGAKDYYGLMFQSYKNSLIYGVGNDAATAAATASADIYSKLGYNPFNVANGNIVGTDGVVNPDAKVIAKGLDWFAPMEQTGRRKNLNFSASGGGEKHDFFFSLGYLDETGYVIKSDFERLNARLSANANPTKWLKVGTNLSFANSVKGLSSTATGNTSFGNPFRFARYMGPIYPVYQVDAEGNYILDAAGDKIYDDGGGYDGQGGRPTNEGRNVVAEMNYNFSETTTTSISNRSYATINILENLSFTTNVGLDISNSNEREFENALIGDGAPDGRYSEDRSRRETVNVNQILNYNTKIGEDHSLELLVGHEYWETSYDYMSAMKTKLTVSGINVFDNFVTPASLDGAVYKKSTEGYLARLKYNFQDKYYFEGSFRRDGTSVFHSDVQWGNFYSLGATWRMDQEDFIENISWIDQLKLRASYGEVGNDRLGSSVSSYYGYQAKYEPYPNAGASGLRLADLGNAALGWEVSRSFDLAVEYTVLNNRLHGSVEFYHKISEDLLFDMPLAPTMGLSSQPRNIATLFNRGFEIGLGGTIIDNDSFSWDMQIQASTVKNEITEIPTPNVNGSKRWAKGHSIYDYYLYDYAGVDAATGDALYNIWENDVEGDGTHQVFDANGDAVTSTNEQDSELAYTGDSSIPDLFGSVSNIFKYKDFSLSVLFTYGIGGKILDYNYRNLMSSDFGDALHVDQKGAWMKAGDVTDIPRLQDSNSHLAPTSNRWLTDASYLSLKSVNLSYNLPKHIVTKIGLSNVKVFAAGENLFMLTAREGLNPQEAFSGTTSNVYLPSKVISFGVNVSF